tara:strand:+ start:53 stop:340 length:288 start_codon:yes stop_codon:yes gene_type:complete
MPFALIPDGFKLQKVTKLQKEAVDKYNSSKNIEAFFEGPASAELVKAVAIVVTPIVLAALAKQGASIGKESLDKIIDKTLESFNIDLSALGQFNL